MKARIAAGATVVALLLAGEVAIAGGSARAATSYRYRHGVELRVGQAGLAGASAGTRAVSTARDLEYGGGTTAPGYSTPVGVTTGTPRVYLVYWGSQWGSASTDGNGDTVLTGDPSQIAPVQQEFFRGLGTGGETWSGVMTQYCEGVSAGALGCGPSSARVGYPTGGALAGVWVDNAHAAPASATAHQLAAEAVAAAGHFGNLDATANRNAQYVIVSPTGTNPDHWLDPTNGFCAWHDYSADPSLTGGAVSSPYGAVAFTNMPYLPDVGASCGAGFVNSPGTDDGVTIVGGHEYAETLTDQFPGGGWLDAGGSEDADKCAWISSGTGASQDITLTTGTFPVQTTWANDGAGGAGTCEVSHPIGVTVGPVFTSGTAATFSSTLTQSFRVKSSAGSTLSETGTLPPRVSFVAGTGSARIVGIAPAGSEGVYPLSITAADPVASTTQSFVLTVVPTRKITSPATATFTHGVDASFTVTTRGTFGRGTAGSPQLPTLTETGALPGGLSFHDNGDGTASIAGSATAAGRWVIVVRAAAALASTQRLTIVVS